MKYNNFNCFYSREKIITSNETKQNLYLPNYQISSFTIDKKIKINLENYPKEEFFFLKDQTKELLCYIKVNDSIFEKQKKEIQKIIIITI